MLIKSDKRKQAGVAFTKTAYEHLTIITLGQVRYRKGGKDYLTLLFVLTAPLSGEWT